MKYTGNYNLKKPEGTDLVKIDDFNDNADILDAELGKKADKTQVLTNVPAGAKFTDTVYTHPSTHPPSIISQDANNRFMTDVERNKLAGVATSANNYVHPAGAGNNHIPTGGVVGQILKNTASGTATWQAESITPVINTLTSTSTTSALSANQGKVLDGKITNIINEGIFVKTITGSSVKNWDNLTESGIYAVSITDMDNDLKSMGVYHYGIVTVKVAGNVIVQSYIPHSTTDNLGLSSGIATRVLYGSRWSSWALDAISETGRNSNGSYIKYRDGTMICYHNIEGTISGVTGGWNAVREHVTWVFPATFSSNDFQVSGSIDCQHHIDARNRRLDDNRVVFAKGGTSVNTLAIISFQGVVYSTGKTAVSLTAIGRWK